MKILAYRPQMKGLVATILNTYINSPVTRIKVELSCDFFLQVIILQLVQTHSNK